VAELGTPTNLKLEEKEFEMGNYGESSREVAGGPGAGEVHPERESVAAKYTNHEETPETAPPKRMCHLNCEERAVSKTHRGPLTKNETGTTKLLDYRAVRYRA
jgi:hypothetical protein